MTVLAFARPYTACDIEPDDLSMLEFIDSETGKRLAIDYASTPVFTFKPGDTLAIFHRHYLVTLEGKFLGGLCELLGKHRIRRMRTFYADVFQPPAPGQPLVERLHIADRPPSSNDWERWVCIL